MKASEQWARDTSVNDHMKLPTANESDSVAHAESNIGPVDESMENGGWGNASTGNRISRTIESPGKADLAEILMRTVFSQ